MPLSAGRCSTSRDRGKKGEEGLEDKGGWPRSSLEEHRWTTCVDKYNRRWPGPCLRLFLPFPFFFLPRRHFANPLGIPLNFSEGGEGRHSSPPPSSSFGENFKLQTFVFLTRHSISPPTRLSLLSAFIIGELWCDNLHPFVNNVSSGWYLLRRKETKLGISP